MAFEKSDDLTVNFRAMSLGELMLAVAEIQRDLVELRRAFAVKKPIPSPTEPSIVGRKSPGMLNECRSPVKSRKDLFFPGWDWHSSAQNVKQTKHKMDSLRPARNTFKNKV